MLPLHLGDESQFRTVREFLAATGYTEPSAAERMGLSRLDQLTEYHLYDHTKRDRNALIRDRLGVVVNLFLRGQELNPRDVQEFIPDPVLKIMRALGLVEWTSARVLAPVLLYPAHGLYLVSDRYVNPDESAVSPGSDFVYLVLHQSTTDFIHSTPASQCETFLDLGGGSGVGGLWAAKNFAAHAWSSDITPRATHFAEFNRRLNGIANATVVQGDMYAPVAGLTFDRISTHPPYVISPTSDYVYADGGEDGEILVQRAIAEAPAHLTPGGILTCTSMASDRAGQPLEQRIRQWLGDAGAHYDVAVLVNTLTAPMTYATNYINAHKRSLRELDQWRSLFERHKIEGLVYGWLVIRRHAQSGQKPFTIRRLCSEKTDRSALEWMLAWEAAAAQPDRDEFLLAARPVASPRAELLVRHQVLDGDLRPVDYTFRTSYPFNASQKCPSWAAYLFSRCDGQRTGAELLAEVHPNVTSEENREEFLKGMTALISGGFLEIEPFRVPAV